MVQSLSSFPALNHLSRPLGSGSVLFWASGPGVPLLSSPLLFAWPKVMRSFLHGLLHPRVSGKCVSPMCQACWEHGNSVGNLGYYGVREFVSNHMPEGQSEVPEQELMDCRLGGLGL